jgi:hypothetical protein
LAFYHLRKFFAKRKGVVLSFTLPCIPVNPEASNGIRHAVHSGAPGCPKKSPIFSAVCVTAAHTDIIAGVA